MTALHLGFTCNNRCVFCAQGDLRQSVADPTSDDIATELAQLADGGTSHISLVGGEPTVRPDLPDIVTRARDLGFRSIALQTNGRRLAYRKYADELAGAGLTRVEISLQGARAEVHDYHTSSPESGAQTLGGIESARAAGLRVAVATVLTRSSYRHLAELAEAVVRLGVEAIHVAFPIARGSAAASFDRVVPRLAAVRPHIQAAARTARSVPVFSSRVPLCLLDGNEAGALHLHGHAHDGVFGDDCGGCPLRSLCPGVEPTYAERFGLDEITPPAADRSTEIRDRVRRLTDLALDFAGPGRLDG